MTLLNIASAVKLGATTVDRLYVGATCVHDKDAAAFLASAAITDLTIVNAVTGLVVGLKDAGIWTALDAVYPIVGGTAAAHKFNLKDPRDLDAAYRLTFAGGVTHSSDGMVSDGTSGWADTHWVASTQLALGDGSMGFYSRTNATYAAKTYDMGAISTVGGTAVVCCIAALANLQVSSFSIGGSINNAGPTTTDTSGLWATNRVSANIQGWHNGAKIHDAAGAGGNTPLPTASAALMAVNQAGTSTRWSPRQQAFAFLGHTLTATQLGQLYTIVQAFETALGRQV